MSDDDAGWAPDTPQYDADFSAVSHGRLEDVKKTLTPTIYIDPLLGDGCCEGKSALHLASAAGHTDIVEFLLESGVSVDIQDRGSLGSSTPLHEAAFHGQYSVVKLLLDKGADLNSLGEQDSPVLHEVLWNKPKVLPQHIETIKVLLDYGHDIESQNFELGGTVVSSGGSTQHFCEVF